MQAYLEAGALPVGGEPLDLRIFKIIMQFLPDLQLRKDIKKSFGHKTP